MPRGKRSDPPNEVQAIRSAIDEALNMRDASGKRVGDATRGVYAFFDYDGEPIYVGQTSEKLRSRIRRHLTNQRTDAVAMKVLDPFEVADIEMWPFWDLAGADKDVVEGTLNSAEYTLFQLLLGRSTFGAVLNEVAVAKAPVIDLPKSVRARIVPAAVYELRQHSDIRIARRADTIARLAQVISEREVQPGLRLTLLTQARRLEHLARHRLDQVGGSSTTDDGEGAG